MNDLLTVAQLVLLSGTLIFWIVAGVALVRIRRKARSLEDTIRSFITSPDKDTPSPLALTVDQLAQVFARGVIAQAQTTIMGIRSGNARAQNAAEAQAALAKYPWLAMLSQIMPSAAKTLAKNPALLNIAGSMFNRPSAQGTAGNGHNPAQQPMDLKIGGE